ncbi:MAG TPA: lipoprotein [Casimicrobiaceae bacterium]
MLRLHARAAVRLAIVAIAAIALTACGTKGPLVPAKRPADTATPAASPGPPTSAPDIPSATLPSPTRPAP